MRKLVVMVSVAVMSVFIFSQAAFPWGSAVHTYIDDHVGSTKAKINIREMFGGTGPDIFNYRYDQSAMMRYMYGKTHTEFMRVWREAESMQQRALAFGYVSHNDVWGADVTAHHNGITYGQGMGYAIAKADILKNILIQAPEFAIMPDAVVQDIAHTLVETGIDVLMKHVDPQIGAKMIAAAMKPHPQFTELMVEVYARDLSRAFKISRKEAAEFIIASDKQFSQIEVMYGQALMQDDATAVRLLAEQLATAAVAYLASNGIVLPPGTDLSLLAQFGIAAAMQICAPDFFPEVAATISLVDQQLDAHNVEYRHQRE